MPPLSSSRTLLLTMLIVLAGEKAFSQPVQMNIIYRPDKASDRKALRFISRMGPSPGFTPYYTKFMDRLNDYSRKDSLLADALIIRLNHYRENAFYRLLQVRLIWNFKHRLLTPLLDNTIPYLENAADSANYCYTKGVYYKDSIYYIIGRKFAFIRLDNRGEEVVDWKKMETLPINHPKVLARIGGHVDPYEVFTTIKIKDSTIFYYRKAVEQNKTEVSYLERWIDILPLILSPDEKDKEIQSLFSAYLSNYYPKDQKRLLRKLKE